MENLNTPTPAAPIKWYHYIAAFWAGAFLANTVPHYINGVSGNAFPSPFADPPGIGPSSPVVNVLWASFNLLVGYLLFRASRTNSRTKGLLVVLFVGMLTMSLFLASHFVNKMPQ